MWTLLAYECVACLICGAEGVSFSSRSLSTAQLLWSLLPPQCLLLALWHLLSWYLYLLLFGLRRASGVTSSLRYLHALSAKLPSSWPRALNVLCFAALALWLLAALVVGYSELPIIKNRLL